MIKKLLLECIVVFSIGFTIGWFGWKQPVHQPPKEFTIYQSLIIGSANYQQVMLKKYPVHVQDYDVDEMCDNIQTYHDWINGEPDKFDIRIFDSKEDLVKWNCRAEKTYYKDSLEEEKGTEKAESLITSLPAFKKQKILQKSQ